MNLGLFADIIVWWWESSEHPESKGIWRKFFFWIFARLLLDVEQIAFLSVCVLQFVKWGKITIILLIQKKNHALDLAIM